MKLQSLADGQVFQDRIKIYPPLARADIRKAYSNGNLMLKEETRKPDNTKTRDKEGLWGCSGSALMACRPMDLKPERDLITVDKAQVVHKSRPSCFFKASSCPRFLPHSISNLSLFSG